MRATGGREGRFVSTALLLAGLTLPACDGDVVRRIIDQSDGHGHHGEGGAGGATAPQVVIATQPADGATGVEPTATIQATFAHDLDPASVAAQVFRVVRDDDGQRVAGTVTYEPATRTVTFAPEQPLALLASYTASVAGGAWRFTTRDGRWETPQVISDGNGYAEPPRLGIDAAGNATAVWWQRSPERDDIWSNRFDQYFGWGTPALIEHEDAGSLMWPDLAVAANGKAAAVWYGPQFGSTAFIVGGNRFLPESGWQTAEPAGNGAQSSGDPRVDIDNDGVVTVIWTRFVTGHETVVNQFVPGVGWGTPVVLGSDDDGIAGYAPRAVSDGDGNVTAVWAQNANSGPTLWFSRFVPGSGWSAASLVPTGHDKDSNDPELAVDGAGNVTVAWNQYGPVDTHVWSNRFVPGQGWQTPVQIDTTVATAGSPKLAASARGEVVALWRQDIEEESGTVDYRVVSARFSPGQGWGPPTIVQLTPGFSNDFAIATDAVGDAIAVWDRDDATGSDARVWISRSGRNTGWSTPTWIHPDGTTARWPEVAIDPAGRAVAIWLEGKFTYPNPSVAVWARVFR
jgi:hypothetical protein